VPTLCRGWRTPDPSPTRNAVHLPGCGPRTCRMEGEEAADCSTPRRAGGGGRAVVATEEKDPRKTSRTPSPEPILCVPCAPPAVMADPWLLSADCGSTCMQSMWCMEAQATQLVREPSPHSASSSASTAVEGCEDEIWVPPPPTPAGYVVVPLITPLFDAMPVHNSADFAPGLWSMPDDSQLESVGMELSPEAFVPAQPCLSRGSVGHPFTCAEFCKYAKKARGCKDGANCDRCHLCTCKSQKQQVQTPSRHRARRGHRG